MTRINLAVVGRGAVSPGGVGVAGLLGGGDWPTAEIPAIGSGRPPHQAFMVELSDERLKRWQEHPRLRRASPITYFMMEAARQALDETGEVPPERLGIVVALSTGCIVYTRKFFAGLIQDGRRFASPQLFPETVFNAPASHLGHVLGAKGPCYSVVGDDTAWVSALRTAECWLRRDLADNVLVLAGEELDAVTLAGFSASRWMRKGSRFIAAEGASAVVVRRAKSSDSIRMSALAEGWSYRNRATAKSAAVACFAEMGGGIPVYRSAARSWLGGIENEMLKSRAAAEPALPYCGQALCASAGWHTLRAASLLNERQPSLWVPIWGLNHQLSALQLSVAEKQST